MRLFGHNRNGKAKCSTKPRKRNGKTKAEKNLGKRVDSFNAACRVLGIKDPRAEGYHKPGSLQLN